MLDEYKNTKLFENKKITIHLPDYLNKHTLFDPFSQNKKTKTESIQMIEKVIDFYQNVKSDTENFVLVSSIGVNSYQNKEGFYINLEKLIKPFGFNLSIYKVSKNIAEMRTYENGVGETFSCGSAALAVTSLCIKNKFKTISPGGELNFIKKNNANIEMMGPAKYIYSGNIDV